VSTELGELPEYHEIIRARDVLCQIIEGIENGLLTLKGGKPFLTVVEDDPCDDECQNPNGCRCVIAGSRWVPVADDATCDWCASRAGLQGRVHVLYEGTDDTGVVHHDD
jgi:hypothetical protein